MFYYAIVLKVVWNIRSPAYRTKAVCRKRSCRLVGPVFHLVGVSFVRDICWFGFRGSAPRLIWTSIPLIWGRRLRWRCLFAFSFSLAACGYSSHCICSYGRMSYLWVTFLSISNWQWVINRLFLDWACYKGFFVILAKFLAWSVAIWVIYGYDFFCIFGHLCYGLMHLLSNKMGLVCGYF